MNVVFISSLAHSGSTLLDLLLGSHPKLIGLGEIYKVIGFSAKQLDGERSMRCTCGQKINDCQFWSPAFDELKKHAELNLRDKYQLLLDVFQKVFGEDYYLVDSSKYNTPLSLLTNLDTVQLSVIHLIKDVRAFTVSHRDALPAELKYKVFPTLFGSPSISQTLYGLSIKSPGYLFWKWYLRNRAAQSRIKNVSTNSISVSYEEIALATETSMLRLFAFLDLALPKNMSASPANTQSHIFMGNHMIADSQKMRAIRYDNRWQSRSDWKAAARLFPTIMAYNSEQVYTRIEESDTV
jgi:hypothetical protein